MTTVLPPSINDGVQPAMPGEFTPLHLGSTHVWPPVVLAPMAGVTNVPFRRLCRGYGAGLYVSEMITARGYVEGGAKTRQLAQFPDDESPRSIQLYGTDAHWIGEAVRVLVDEGHVDHIDLNFGCPAKKVMRHGGGAAVPARPALYRDIVAAAVDGAGDTPVTVKFRIGVDDVTTTFLEAGRIAAGEGVAWVALHGRTAEQLYSGLADWRAIAALKEAVPDVPVLGNGDIWEARDALRMMRQTGCDGVVVGRGCLGRPWIFGELRQVFDGASASAPAASGVAVDALVRHAALHCEWFGEEGIRDLRKHTGWYFKGYPIGNVIRRELSMVSSHAELTDRLGSIDRTLELPLSGIRAPRGHTGGPKKVTLPEGWLEHRLDNTPPAIEADALVSGG